MMATPRISIDSDCLVTGSTSVLGVHVMANRGSESNGCNVCIGIVLGRWAKSYHRTGRR